MLKAIFSPPFVIAAIVFVGLLLIPGGQQLFGPSSVPMLSVRQELSVIDDVESVRFCAEGIFIHSTTAAGRAVRLLPVHASEQFVLRLIEDLDLLPRVRIERYRLGSYGIVTELHMMINDHSQLRLHCDH